MQQFLDELTKLTQKYGLIIGGCGCCESPWVANLKNEKIGERLEWNKNQQKYEIHIDSDF